MNLKPITLKNGVTLRNPLVMAPMTVQLSYFNGHVTGDEIRYYANRSHDVGAVITAAANVQAIGKGWQGELGIYDDEFLPELSQLAQAIQAGGAKAIVQLFHAGRMTDSSVLNGRQPVSASAIAAERPQAELPRALSEKEIWDLIEDFKAATRRAIDASFDGIELHGANTYIIQQFYSPHSNRRKDEWGGSREKRFHFIDTLIDEVLTTVSTYAKHPFIVGYRFLPEEFEKPGLRMADTFYLADRLAEKGLDYLHLSTNDYQRRPIEEEYQEKTILAYVAERLAGRLPLIGVGSVEKRQQVEEVLELADLVAVGRSLLHDPDWGKKILNDQETADLRKLPIAIDDYGKQGIWNFVQAIRLDKNL